MKYLVFVNGEGEVVAPSVKVLEDSLSEIGMYETVYFPEHWTPDYIESVISFSGTNLVQKFGNPLLQEPLSKGSKILRLRSRAMLSKAIRSHCVAINEAAAECINGEHGRFIGVKDCLLVIVYDDTVGRPTNSFDLFKEDSCKKFKWRMLRLVDGILTDMAS